MNKRPKNDPGAVAYYRVSTKGQGRSGLGLQAQKDMVHRYVRANRIKIAQEFIEVESGKKMHRPVIEAAIEYCKRHDTKLLIATLDRLTRRVLFVALLIESKVDFTAVDKPFADKYDIYMDAVNAERESDNISKRTRAALNVAKQRGIKLGKFGKVLAKRNKARSNQFLKRLKPILLQLRKSGFNTAQSMVDELVRRKISNYRNGKSWHVSTIYTLLHRMK